MLSPSVTVPTIAARRIRVVSVTVTGGSDVTDPSPPPDAVCVSVALSWVRVVVRGRRNGYDPSVAPVRGRERQTRRLHRQVRACPPADGHFHVSRGLRGEIHRVSRRSPPPAPPAMSETAHVPATGLPHPEQRPSPTHTSRATDTKPPTSKSRYLRAEFVCAALCRARSCPTTTVTRLRAEGRWECGVGDESALPHRHRHRSRPARLGQLPPVPFPVTSRSEVAESGRPSGATNRPRGFDGRTRLRRRIPDVNVHTGHGGVTRMEGAVARRLRRRDELWTSAARTVPWSQRSPRCAIRSRSRPTCSSCGSTIRAPTRDRIPRWRPDDLPPTVAPCNA